MADCASIKLTKSFTYRGGVKRWSNRYYIGTDAPLDHAHWQTLADNVVAAEKLIFTVGQHIVAVDGYEAGSEIPVFHEDINVAGTYAASGQKQAPGDCVALMRWSTDQRTTKNHPIYLFKYWHGVQTPDSGDPDVILAAQAALYNTYAAAWVTGFTDGLSNYHLTGPRGASALDHFLEPYVMHRDFPR